jgi:hypothetical protein
MDDDINLAGARSKQASKQPCKLTLTSGRIGAKLNQDAAELYCSSLSTLRVQP